MIDDSINRNYVLEIQVFVFFLTIITPLFDPNFTYFNTLTNTPRVMVSIILILFINVIKNQQIGMLANVILFWGATNCDCPISLKKNLNIKFR